MKCDRRTLVAFDLDDTLFQEMEFVRSAYREIARLYGRELLPRMLSASTPAEAFDSTGLPIEVCLDVYRNHFPDIALPWRSLYALEMLKRGGFQLALVTDGRSVTQGNKIAALGLTKYFAPEMIFVSEEVGESKTTGRAFRRIMELAPADRYFYVGDNPQKDFAVPRSLGWSTVALLDSGENVHSQNFQGVDPSALPDCVIHSLTELLGIVGL